MYAPQLLDGCVSFLEIGKQNSSEVMISATLDLMNSIAVLIEKEFGKYFGKLMPFLIEILKTVESKSTE